jgi:hypothetical protein
MATGDLTRVTAIETEVRLWEMKKAGVEYFFRHLTGKRREQCKCKRDREIEGFSR